MSAEAQQMQQQIRQRAAEARLSQRNDAESLMLLMKAHMKGPTVRTTKHAPKPQVTPRKPFSRSLSSPIIALPSGTTVSDPTTNDEERQLPRAHRLAESKAQAKQQQDASRNPFVSPCRAEQLQTQERRLREPYGRFRIERTESLHRLFEQVEIVDREVGWAGLDVGDEPAQVGRRREAGPTSDGLVEGEGESESEDEEDDGWIVVLPSVKEKRLRKREASRERPEASVR